MAEVTGPDFSKNELIPAIAQDSATGDVLMMAWMNKESYEETLRTGRVCYYSRSRKKLWRKGEESGNVQQLHAIYFDCDGDTLLVKVNQIGRAACHEGAAQLETASRTRRPLASEKPRSSRRLHRSARVRYAGIHQTRDHDLRGSPRTACRPMTRFIGLRAARPCTAAAVEQASP